MTKRTPRTGLEDHSLYTYTILLEQAFSKAGFGYVEVMDRWLPRQKSRHGGYEMTLTGKTGDAKTTVIVKIIRSTFRERNFSELDGAIKKAGADFGILVSPFVQSERFSKAHGLHERIDILAGFELLDLFRQYGIAVDANGNLDTDYLNRLDSLENLHNSKLREFTSDVQSSCG